MRRRRPSVAVIALLSAIAVAIAEPASAEHAAAPTSSASAAPSTRPPGTTEAPAAHVVLQDRRVFAVHLGRGGRSAEQRAQSASQALARVADEPEAREVRVEEQGEHAVVFAGSTPIIQLSAEDAAAVGDASLSVHAAAVAAKTREALRAERRRAATARSVFSFSLLVFSGLLAFLLLRKLDELVERFRAWMGARPDRLPALRVGGIEVVRPTAVRGGASVALTIAKRLAQIGLGYGWLIIALSLFESTRGYTERLTGFVLRPVSELMGRVASALPLVVIAVITMAAVGGVIRFVRLFFGSVARGETTLGWLPRDLAPATGVLVRAGIVVITLVVAAPLITGTDDGAISRVGAVALGALGLSSTPLLATAAAGIALTFGRRLRVGDHAVIGGREGRVRAMTLLEVVLEDAQGGAVHVPHLAALWHPTRVLGASPPLRVEIAVDPAADLAAAQEALEQAALSLGPRARVTLGALDARGAVFHLEIEARPEMAEGARSRLLHAAASALRQRGVALAAAASGARSAAP